MFQNNIYIGETGAEVAIQAKNAAIGFAPKIDTHVTLGDGFDVTRNNFPSFEAYWDHASGSETLAQLPEGSSTFALIGDPVDWEGPWLSPLAESPYYGYAPARSWVDPFGHIVSP